MSNQRHANLRKYIGSDAAMLEAAEVMLAAFEQHLAHFEAYDSSLNAAFATEWRNAIAAARAMPTDVTVRGEQKHKTQTMKAAMQQAVETVLDVLFFVEKAFKGNAAIIAAFGKGRGLMRARYSQPRMIEFLDELAARTAAHATALAAAGAPPATLAAPAAALATLRQANLEQNTATSARPATTAARISAMNHAYTYMQQVIKAAARIFAHRPETLGHFRYRPPVARQRKPHKPIQK